ncbi:MAG: hypothetical protein EZS28_049856, partial [Streblomastix strix]
MPDTNTGTCSNQFVAVDYNLHNNRNSSGLLPYTITLVEDYPGNSSTLDLTNILMVHGYFIMYNVPYTNDAYINLGYADYVMLSDTNAFYFANDTSVRANIFHKLLQQNKSQINITPQLQVKNLDDMQHILRYNRYWNDTESKHPVLSIQDPCASIAARCDLRIGLNKSNNSFELNKDDITHLTKKASGAIDAKVISSAMAKRNNFLTIMGPPTTHEVRNEGDPKSISVNFTDVDLVKLKQQLEDQAEKQFLFIDGIPIDKLKDGGFNWQMLVWYDEGKA